MCHFIYLTLPQDADIPAIRKLAGMLDRVLEPIDSHPANCLLTTKEVLYRTTKGMCDCGTCLGSAANTADGQADYHADVVKLRRKGWSSAKIDRWLEAKTTADQRSLEQKRQRTLARIPTPTLWADFLRNCVTSGHAKRVGLLLTFESRSAVGFQPGDRQPVETEELTPDFLLHISENRLYQFGA